MHLRTGLLHRWFLAALLLCVLAAHSLPASEPIGLGEDLDGIGRCVGCHDESANPQLLGLYQTAHGQRADPAAPMAAGCVGCHGDSSAHLRRRDGVRPPPDISFRESDRAAGDRQCLSCHQGSHQLHWTGSSHQRANVGCVDCHQSHLAHDPALDKLSETESCLSCHTKQRSDLRNPFRHPLHEGQMSCSGCHQPHGSAADDLLRRTTTNPTCYECHAEKRGPFLWEHPPAAEDCGTCHAPHGSVHAGMLKQRAVWLCQSCHMANFHPSTAFSGSGLPGATLPSGAQQMLGRNCMNCHAQVHGSNHPSGPGFTR